MTVSYGAFPIVIGGMLGLMLAESLALPDWAAAACGLTVGIFGVVAWWYSPLPDDNGGMAGSRFRGKYWGFSPPSHLTTEEFTCRECGHGPMLFDTRADDLHLRFEENDKDWMGRTIMYVGRCENCNKKIGWRDKTENPAPEPPEGYSDPTRFS